MCLLDRALGRRHLARARPVLRGQQVAARGAPVPAVHRRCASVRHRGAAAVRSRPAGPARPAGSAVRLGLQPPRRTAGPPDTDDLAAAAKWAERNSPLLTALNERAVARCVLDSLTVRMDGQPAAANTVARRRAVLYNALEYTVELDRLPSNPLTRVKWKAPKVAELVDVRTVVNQRPGARPPRRGRSAARFRPGAGRILRLHVLRRLAAG